MQPGDHGPRVVDDDSAAWTPHVLNGYVESFAESGNTMVVGGNFTQIRPANDTTAINRSYLFSFQKGSGAINSNFSPELNGQVTSVIPSGDGQTVFVGGGFSSVNGETVRSVTKLDLATGARVAQFNPPAFNGRVHDLQLRNGKLYVSGRFTTVGGAPQTALAAVDPITGALDPNVKAVFSDPRNGGAMSLMSSDITPDGSKMVAIGNFTKINGQDRYQIAVLDLTTSPISLANWQTTRYGNGCSGAFQSYMRDVDISPDGSYFVVATTGAYSAPGGILCDTTARWDLSATGSNLQPAWVDYSGGDTLTEIAITEDVVYVGGHQRRSNNPYAADNVGAGAVTREGLQALDPRSGATLSWNPGRTRGYGVYTFLATDSGLWIGSDTDRISDWEYRGRMAFMPLSSGTDLPIDWAGDLPGKVVSLGLNQGGTSADLDRVTTRSFDGVTVTNPTTTAGTEDWSSVRGAFMIDGKLFTGWSDSTLRVQDYDGTSFGPQSQVPLALIPGNSASLNRFATQDLSTITGMFYDPALGRLYFTKSGNNYLYYRSFSSESRIVGAERMSSAIGAAGVDWSAVRSMFIGGGKLFIAGSNGNLVSYQWDASTGLPVQGSASTVSGPAIDGQDWRAQDAFVYAEADYESPNAAPVAAIGASCSGANCQLDASASTDSDGTIVSYSWNFGDGTAPGVGVQASHTYAASGIYTVSVTVTDNRGGTDTATMQVTVDIPNQPPGAEFTSSCTGLECAFDGAASADPDGNIVSYQWNFGDNSTGSGVAPTHEYAAPGSYTVSLTVTDDDGATNTSTKGISVIDPTATPSAVFRSGAYFNDNTLQATVTVPNDVRAGDQLVLLSTVNNLSTNVTGPAGWTLLESRSDPIATVQTFAWTKTATASDAGTAVSVGNTIWTKTALHLLAYSGAEPVTTYGVAIDTASSTSRTTPVVPVTAPGSVLVSYWADKSSDSTGWTLPAGVTERNQNIGIQSGKIAAAVADTGPVAAGSAGGFTATSSSVNRRGVVWSIVVPSSATAANLPPSADFSNSCAGLACTFNAGGSNDVDGSIVSYSWNFGDGSTGNGVNPQHEYTTAGTYSVVLTVTDDDGDSGSTSRQVSVSEAPAGQVTFRASAGMNNNVLTASVDVPAQVQPGDVMVLFATVNNLASTVTGPAGWTLVGSADNGSTTIKSYLWTRVATAVDLSAPVQVVNSTWTKTALQLSAYSGASGVSSFASNIDAVNHAERTTPVVPVAQAGSMLVSYWADKSSSTTSWTLPPGVQLRQLDAGELSGRVVAALGDSGSLAPGQAGGLTATADSTSPRGLTWSVVLAPSS